MKSLSRSVAIAAAFFIGLTLLVGGFRYYYSATFESAIFTKALILARDGGASEQVIRGIAINSIEAAQNWLGFANAAFGVVIGLGFLFSFILLQIYLELSKLEKMRSNPPLNNGRANNGAPVS